MKYNSFTELPGYSEDIEKANNVDIYGREFTFYSLVRETTIGNTIVNNFSMSKFLSLQQINHPILSQDFCFESCMSFILFLKKKTLIERLPFIGNIIALRNIMKNANHDISVVINSTQQFFLYHTIDIPGYYSDVKQKQFAIEGEGASHYYLTLYVAKLKKTYNLSFKEILELPVGLFYQFLSLSNYLEGGTLGGSSYSSAIKKKYLRIYNQLKKEESKENS